VDCTFEDGNIRVAATKHGFGLVANRNLEAGMLLGMYCGTRIDERLALIEEKELGNVYLFDVEHNNKQTTIDARDHATASAFRYVNAPDDEKQINARFLAHKKHVYVQLVRDVSEGHEILASYGTHRATKKIIRMSNWSSITTDAQIQTFLLKGSVRRQDLLEVVRQLRFTQVRPSWFVYTEGQLLTIHMPCRRHFPTSEHCGDEYKDCTMLYVAKTNANGQIALI
jgi:hypothetical protein